MSIIARHDGTHHGFFCPRDEEQPVCNMKLLVNDEARIVMGGFIAKNLSPKANDFVSISPIIVFKDFCRFRIYLLVSSNVGISGSRLFRRSAARRCWPFLWYCLCLQ